VGNLDFILDWTKKLKQEIQAIDFLDDDIRKDYFRMTHDVAYCYYEGYSLFKIFGIINQHDAYFHNSIIPYEKHFQQLRELATKQTLQRSYVNSLNRNLLIGAWSTFEFCVTALCEGILDEKETEKLLQFEYRDILKIVKIQLNDAVLDKLKMKKVKHNLIHVPIIRKTDQLFKRTKGYGRNVDDDKDFLVFMSKLRNSHHSNFIYYDKDYEYRYGNAYFRFHNGKNVGIDDPFEPTPKLNFYLIGNLKNIWKELVCSIHHPEPIINPFDASLE